MGLVNFVLFLYCITIILPTAISSHDSAKSEIIDVKGGPDDVVWVVQLSDLHFSVHNPERALDFKQLVPSALSMINPSLVLITGDLTGYTPLP